MSADGTSRDDPIEAKIAWAEQRYSEHEAWLRTHPEIGRLLRKLGEGVHESDRGRVEAGIAALCATCERDRGISCCNADLEDRHDGVTLLINLLLGATLPRKRRGPRDCLFLGDDGCLLVARDALCVNFLCQTITEGVEPEKIAAVREREGEELETRLALHARVSAEVREFIDE
jgi:hypothetical protein